MPLVHAGGGKGKISVSAPPPFPVPPRAPLPDVEYGGDDKE